METSPTPQLNKTQIASKWALIYLVISIVLTYLIQFLKVDPNSPVKYISILPFIALLCLAQLEYKKKNEGFMSFGEGFSVGFRFALFGGIMLAVFTYIYLAILSPDVMAQSMEAARDKMVEQGLSEEQIEKSISIATKFGPVMGSFMAAVMYALAGAVISLITAAIFKNDRPLFDKALSTETY